MGSGRSLRSRYQTGDREENNQIGVRTGLIRAKGTMKHIVLADQIRVETQKEAATTKLFAAVDPRYLLRTIKKRILQQEGKGSQTGNATSNAIAKKTDSIGKHKKAANNEFGTIY